MHDLETAGFKDIMVGATLWKALGVPSYEFSSNPSKFQQLTRLAKFLNEHPDPLWVIDRTRNNKSSKSNLDFLSEYVNISTEKSQVAEKLNSLDKELKLYENG